MSTENRSEADAAWKDWIDPASKLGALSLFIIYAAGYLVTSINLAAHGMVVANPLRPRIAAAGVLFCFLFGLPVWACSQTMNSSQVPTDVSRRPWYSVNYRLLRFSWVSFILGLPISVIFTFDRPFSKWRLWSLISLMLFEPALVASAGVSSRLSDAQHAHPRAAENLYLLLNLGFFGILMSAVSVGNFNFLNVSLWVYACGIFVSGWQFKVPTSFGGTWPTALVQSLAPILLFSTAIYPHIKSEWGGGKGTEIVVRFTKESPIFASQKVALELVDETDSGLYVLQQHTSHALFLPRGDIAAISYSSDLKEMP